MAAATLRLAVIQCQVVSWGVQPTYPEEDLYGERLGAGAVVGAFLIDALIAEGGFATIYRARHLATGEPAAVKVLRGDFAVCTRMLRRFAQEARTVQRIRHPHIVDILEAGTLHDRRPFLAMEWLDGRNLAEELAAGGALPLDQVIALADQIGSALSAAHAAGVVHRDLKAENVMVLCQGHAMTVKVVDFGIAKLLEPEDGEGGLTTVSVIGTPGTMAPEQILRGAVDARTDVYAFGVLLFQLATGRLPFDGATAIEIEDKHLHAPPPRASEHAPVSPRFDAVVARCLQKRKEDRFDDVAALLDALARITAAGAGAEAGLGDAAAHGTEAAIPCVGVHVTAVAAGDPDDDAVLDAMDALLDQAHDVLEAAGLTVAVESGNALLAVAALTDVDPARVREAAARMAGAGLAVAVHAAGAVREGGREDGRFVGGDLFCLGQWNESAPGAAQDAAAGAAPEPGTLQITPAGRDALGVSPTGDAVRVTD